MAANGLVALIRAQIARYAPPQIANRTITVANIVLAAGIASQVTVNGLGDNPTAVDWTAGFAAEIATSGKGLIGNIVLLVFPGGQPTIQNSIIKGAR